MTSLVEQYFDGASRTYNDVTATEEGWSIPSVALAMMRQCDIANRNALCVGGGTGRDINVLSALGLSRISIVDISAEMLNVARDAYPDAEVIHGDVMDDSIQLPVVGVITALGVLEFISDQNAFFCRIRSQLVDGGVALVTYEPLIVGYGPQSISEQRIHSSDDDPIYACKGVHVYRRSPFSVVTSLNDAGLHLIDHWLCRAYHEEDDIFYGLALVQR
jgi:predicted TPR repeat methyltransferase